jgi:hypothetical protein
LPTTSSAEDFSNGLKAASAERHPVGLAAAVDLDVEAGGEGVDDRRADAVQPAGGRVVARVELSARVELRVHDLDAGQPDSRHLVHGDAAAVVAHLDRAVRVEDHVDAARRAGEGLVHGVVDDLPQAVHEAAGVRRSDVHPGALAHGGQTLEDREVACGVLGGGSGIHAHDRRSPDPRYPSGATAA